MKYTDVDPRQMVPCPTLGASLSLRTCVAKHLRWKSCAWRGDQVPTETECNRCALGRERAAALGLTGTRNWGQRDRELAWLRRMDRQGMRRHAGDLE